MSFLLACPECGERSAYEFRFGGEVKSRPQQGDSEEAWFEYIYIKANEAGEQKEWWFHRNAAAGGSKPCATLEPTLSSLHGIRGNREWLSTLMEDRFLSRKAIPWHPPYIAPASAFSLAASNITGPAACFAARAIVRTA